MEKFEYNGIWWLPENPKNKISGTIKFHPAEGSNLDLIGSFKEKLSMPPLKPNIILGETVDGKIITLYNCYESNSCISVVIGKPRLLSSSFIANTIFIGHHFEREEDIIFDSLSLNYSYIEEWAKITEFQYRIDTDSKNHFTKHKISLSIPQNVKARINKLSISFDYNIISGGDRIKEFNLKQNMFIKIEPYKSIHFNDYQRNICYYIQNLLSLAIGRAVFPLIIKGNTKVCKTMSPYGENTVLIFYPITYLYNLSENFYAFEVLIPYRNRFIRK